MIGTVLRIRYELTQLLAEGVVFTTYAARDRVQGREICIRMFNKPFASEPAFVKKVSEAVRK